MIPRLNYELKACFSTLYDEDRWGVLTLLMLHCNERNRCFPTMRGLSRLMGKSLPIVTRAKRWLLDHKAIELVPYAQRSGRERELPQRQHVYQLTGFVEINAVTFQYFYDQYSETSKSDDSKVDVSNPETSTELIQSIIQNKEGSISSRDQEILIVDSKQEENTRARVSDVSENRDSFSEGIDPIPEAVTPYALIDGMFRGMPSTVRPALISYSSKDLEVARALVAKGYTADRIAAYVAWAYEIDGWLQKGKDGLPIKIWMARIAEKIAAYEAAVTPKVKAASQVLEGYEPEHCEQCGGLLQFGRCYVCDAEQKPDYSSIPQAVMDCWRTTWAQIGLQLGKTAATGFMSRIKPLKMEGNTLVLTTGDPESKWWFDKHLFHSFMDTYNQIAKAVGGGDTTVELVLQEDTRLVRTK